MCRLLGLRPDDLQASKGSTAMTSPTRPWSDIARELAREPNRERVTQLSNELNQAIEEQTLNNKPEPTRPSIPGPESNT
jgi:hypothetical protein